MFKRFMILSLLLVFVLPCFINQAVAAGELEYLDNFPDTIFPRSAEPAATVYVFDARRCSREDKTLLATLQGVVNSDIPQLYLILSNNRIVPLDKPIDSGTMISMDVAWVDWLNDNDYIKNIKYLNSIDEVLNKFGVRKVVLADNAFPATLNIACMIGSLEKAAVAYPDQVSKYNLEVVEDLKGKWQTNAEAYKWAFVNLWPKMDHTIIACQTPSISSHLRDYIVAKKIFTLWLPNGDYKGPQTSDDEMAVLKEILYNMPVNIPVIGYPSCGGADKGIGEGLGVRLLSEHGKYLVPTDWRSNQSVWAGLKAKNTSFKQKPGRKLKLEKGKIYTTLLISDGDNMNMWFDFVPTKKYWRSPLRGKLPLAWSIGPSMIDMQAPLLDYYYSDITPMDSMGCAVSGIGYMYPEHYGEAYGDRQGEVLDGYIDITNKYMKKLDLNWVWTTIIGDHAGENIQKYTTKIDNVEALLEGYGRQWWRDEPYMVNDVPVFHFVNDAVDPEPTLKEVLANTPEDRPAFVVIFIQNWPFTLQKIDEMVDSLGDQYEYVRPDELADLYKQYAEQK